jgi:hypothetical protein
MNPKRSRLRKRSFIFAAVGGILAVLLSAWLEIRQPLWLFHRRDFHDGDFVIGRVENFRREKGYFPENLDAFGAKNLPAQIYYQRIDAENYQVWFSVALGESEVYESSTRQWR